MPDCTAINVASYATRWDIVDPSGRRIKRRPLRQSTSCSICEICSEVRPADVLGGDRLVARRAPGIPNNPGTEKNAVTVFMAARST
jgi:hypothetical protein